MVLLDVVCPDGCAPGVLVAIAHPHTGISYDVAIPEGCEPGAPFQVELPDGDAPDGGASSSAPLDAAAVDAAVERKTLTPEQAAALRDIDEALREFSQLGVFIETHSREFREWGKDGEQRLEWSTLHAEYCRLVEGKVEMRLKLIGATGDDLYRLLADVQGNDKRADSFLKKLLAMSDYLDFCEMMRWLGRIETRWAGGRVISTAL